MCILYENSLEEEKKQLEDTYTSHINEKNRLRIDKDGNKKTSNTDPELTIEVYDL